VAAEEATEGVEFGDPPFAAKWGIDAPDALTQLFIEGPWLPAAIRPG
jgi:hypothetical protein